jgi:hypothetical protein
MCTASRFGAELSISMRKQHAIDGTSSAGHCTRYPQGQSPSTVLSSTQIGAERAQLMNGFAG